MTPLAVPILLYHAVDDSPPGWIAPYTVKPDVFHRHLDLIAALGCQPLTVTEMADRLQPGRSWPDRPVVITFDDGFADVASVVAPALAARGFPATVYVTTAALSAGPTCTPHRLPQAAMLRWDQLSALEAGGIELGAHTLTPPAARHPSRRDGLHGDQRQQGRPRRRPRPSCSELRLSPRSSRSPGHHPGPARRIRFRLCRQERPQLGTDDPFALSRLTVLASTPDATLEQWLLGSGSAAVFPPQETADPGRPPLPPFRLPRMAMTRLARRSPLLAMTLAVVVLAAVTVASDAPGYAGELLLSPGASSDEHRAAERSPVDLL